MRILLIFGAVVVALLVGTSYLLSALVEPDPAAQAEAVALQELSAAVFATEPDAELLSVESTNFGQGEARYLVLRWRPRASSRLERESQSARLCAAFAERPPQGFKTAIIAAVVDERVEVGPMAFGRRGLLGYCSWGEPIEDGTVQALLKELDSWR